MEFHMRNAICNNMKPYPPLAKVSDRKCISMGPETLSNISEPFPTILSSAFLFYFWVRIIYCWVSMRFLAVFCDSHLRFTPDISVHNMSKVTQMRHFCQFFPFKCFTGKEAAIEKFSHHHLFRIQLRTAKETLANHMLVCENMYNGVRISVLFHFLFL